LLHALTTSLFSGCLHKIARISVRLCVRFPEEWEKEQTDHPSYRVRGRLHVRIGVRFGVRFVAKGGLQSNLASIFSEMCLQTVVTGE
jgi:hypothetical protein